MAELLLKEEVFAIAGAAMAVYNELGPGFLEAVYHEAMEIELRQRAIPFDTHVPLPIVYKGQLLHKQYEADLIVFNQVVVELKALKELTGLEQAQLLNYLKATGHRVGVLLNFGSHPRLEWKRMVR